MNVLVRLDVREPVLNDGGKLDLLEHVSSPCIVEDEPSIELDHPCGSSTNRLLSVWAYPLLYLVNDAPIAAEV